MQDFPRLFTSRLYLRKIQPEDIPSLVKYANNPKISQYIINIPYPYREPDAAFRISFVVQGFKKKQRVVFTITQIGQNELIGEIGLHYTAPNVAELGFWLGEPFWNQGIITEAAASVVEFGFRELDLEKITATCHEENPASQKVVSAIGMEKRNINGRVALFELKKPA